MRTQSRRSPVATSPYHSHSHPHSHSHASRSHHRPTKSTSSPATSPLAPVPYSVATGQGCQHPMLSPAALNGEVARASSPNYFGLVIESGADSRDSSGLPTHNWSPSSSVKSFAAALPKRISLDANADFEAFKKAADLTKAKSFSFSTTQPLALPTSHPTPMRPRPPRWQTYSSDTGSDASFPRSVASFKARPANKVDTDRDSLHDSAYVSSDSKRNSELSLRSPPTLTGLPPTESPRQTETGAQQPPSLPREHVNDSSLSLNQSRADHPSPPLNSISRAVTLPAQLEPTSPAMITGQRLKELIETCGSDKLLLLDIRSAQNYAQSRIGGALNLCIPTTLLKRATFNLQKLQQTFQGSTGSERFSQWRDMEWIVVYDAHASDKRDAVTAQNMIKKFTNEGFVGNAVILRGGFSAFSTSFPQLVDKCAASRSPARQSPGSVGGGSNLAPVIGGVSLPTSRNDHNPFFSNIRQNMDLADGVGQFDIARPQGLDSPLLPAWIRDVSAESDHGNKVSKKFLNIELDEQSRMRAAYAAFNPDQKQDCKFQLSGVEKGAKNRYKDILPFEHARVRLQETREQSCDYVNASHMSASRSNKRYIASQGPLPTTFEDFWSVIWEQDVRVIVMLTAESEGGQLKCHQYWKGGNFGSIRLKSLSEKRASLDIDKHRVDLKKSNPSTTTANSVLGHRRSATTSNPEPSASKDNSGTSSSDTPYVTIRKFALSHTSHPFEPMREITHLHFSAWPDFGTPAQPSHLLALVELANVMQRAAVPVKSSAIASPQLSTMDSFPMTGCDEPEQDAGARPMLVHCSAGCGRTGVFCTVDSVIDMLKRQRQAKLATTSQPRDADGDVLMDESVSPMTTIREVAPGGFFDRGAGGHHFQTWDSSDIDTTWLADDGVDLIQKTVQDFREQRLSMVQTLRQYVLCYETVLEWLNRTQHGASQKNNTRLRSSSLQQVRP